MRILTTVFQIPAKMAARASTTWRILLVHVPPVTCTPTSFASMTTAQDSLVTMAQLALISSTPSNALARWATLVICVR